MTQGKVSQYLGKYGKINLPNNWCTVTAKQYALYQSVLTGTGKTVLGCYYDIPVKRSKVNLGRLII